MRVQRPTETKRSGRTLAGNSSTLMTTTMITAGLCFPDYLKKKKPPSQVAHRSDNDGAENWLPRLVSRNQFQHADAQHGLHFREEIHGGRGG